MTGGTLRRIDLLRVGLRLTLLQSAWCEGGLQSIGLAYCLIPGLARIHPEPEALDAAVRRHRTPFNTHPYLAGTVAGAVLRMEADGRPPRQIAGFVRDSMGPLAAVGDPFFRGALAPAVSIAAALVALLWGSALGAVALLVLFNLPHAVVRVAGVAAGYRDGELALARVGSWIAARRTRTIRLAAALAVGVLLGVLALRLGGPHPALASLPIAACGLGCAALLARNRAAWPWVVLLILSAAVLAEVAL
jgi:PTS system mannose-specific IID component